MTVVLQPLRRLAQKETAMAAEPTGTPVLDLITSMTAASMEASNLDPETLMLVRIAALVAEGAPTASYLMNLGAAAEIGVDIEQVQGVLAAVAPIVGTTHIVDATGRIAEALGIALVSSE
jgi:4-carboxymuconolactone decarboxylase